MAKPLTPDQLKLAEELKVRKMELHEKARISRKKMIKAYQQYHKLLSSHEHFVMEHARVDRKLHLLTPGIIMLAAVKRKEHARNNVKKKVTQNSGNSIADSMGGNVLAERLRLLIAAKKAKQAKEEK